MRKSLTASSLIGMLFLAVLTAALAPTISAAPPRITIDSEYFVTLGDQVNLSISVVFDPNDPDAISSFGRFDLLVAYDATVAEVLHVSAGSLLIDCGWEGFGWNDDSCSGCPSGLIRITGIADLQNGGAVPSCLADTTGNLAVLHFQVSSDPAFACMFLPIRFLWTSCDDNIAQPGSLADTLLLSNRVFEQQWSGWEDITGDAPFPTWQGAPSWCVSDSLAGATVLRTVDFVDGGIDIMCTDSIDSRGDINLDGLANTIADIVLLANYLYYGESVFTVNTAAQIRATDVNDDNIVLTLDDLVYLARVVIGDALPFPRPSLAPLDTAVIVLDGAAGTVTLTYPDSLRAVYLKFLGPVLYQSPWGTISDPWPHLDGNTPLLAPTLDSILGSTFLPTASGLQLCTYTGPGILVEAQASYDGIMNVPVKIIRQNMPACCQLRGDFDYSGSTSVADITALINFLFRGGPPSICPEHADFDGSGAANVSDLTAFIAYLFRSGPPPAACP